MFFKENINYNIITNNVTKEELEKFLKENNIYLDITDDATAWAAFAQYYGRNNGLNDVDSASFSYMVSLFMTGMGVSASTELYFKEELIEYEILDNLNKLNNTDLSEKDKAVELFNFIFNLYLNDIEKFEYKIFNVNIRLTNSQMEKFNSVSGENKTQKFLELLNNYRG